MAGMKHKIPANAVDASTLSISERILKECHELYSNPENGLVKIGATVGLTLLPPRKKISVMIMGNHSAGKSSFVNWYIEEHVQKTGVAIETQGFTFVTSGRKRESLTGNATLHLYPHFRNLQEIEGVVDYLSTEVTTSKQRKFGLVTFIDTPGLVDGDMKYPFDVNYTMMWLGDLCDLVLVFFDPIGQALCKRTLNIVEQLNEKHPERLRFFLSKADEAGHESDRQRVMMQIVQELCKRPGLNRTAFEMPTIFIPNANKVSRCVNQIDDVCKDVEKSINQMVQTTLNQLEKDCDQIGQLVDDAIRADTIGHAINVRSRVRGMALSVIGFLLPISLLFVLLVSAAPSQIMDSFVGSNLANSLRSTLTPLTIFWEEVGEDNQMVLLTVVLVISGICLLVSRMTTTTRPTLSWRAKKLILEGQEYVNRHVRVHKERLYKEYLQQSISEHDL